MKMAAIHAAKSALSRLLAKVWVGAEIVSASGEKQIVKPAPSRKSQKARRFGALKGAVSVDPEFFEPLSERELTAWE